MIAQQFRLKSNHPGFFFKDMPAKYQKNDAGNTRGTEYHTHHHDLVTCRDQGRDTGKDLPRHHARQGNDTDRQQRIDGRDQ